MSENQPEPWLRGPIDGVATHIAPVLRSFEHAREDASAASAGLNSEQLWARPHGIAAAGFHIRHIGASVDRLVTYLRGEQLSKGQIEALRLDETPGATRDQLLAEMDEALHRAEEFLRGIDAATLGEPRYVGRHRLPTTVMGLLVHISEHTLRHVGQLVTTAKVVRAA